MASPRRIFASLTLAGVLTVAGVGCSSSSKGGASGDFCTKYKKYDKELNNTGSAASDPAALNKVKSAMADLDSSAPASIKSNLDLLLKAFTEYSAALSSKDTAKIQSLGTEFSSAKFTAASQSLQNYTTNTCHVKDTSS